MLFKDNEIAEQILKAHKPGQMKALGRKVTNFDEKIWAENREKIVKKGNIAKVKNVSKTERVFVLNNSTEIFLFLEIYDGNVNTITVQNHQYLYINILFTSFYEHKFQKKV